MWMYILMSKHKLVDMSGALSYVCILLQGVVLLYLLLHGTAEGMVVHYLYFKPRMSRNKRKCSSDICVKKLQVMMLETKVEIIESGVKKTGDIASSCNMNHSTIGTNPKEMDKAMEHEVCCADDVYSNMKEAWKSDGRDRETSWCVDAR